jgi:hypothetical protein
MSFRVVQDNSCSDHLATFWGNYYWHYWLPICSSNHSINFQQNYWPTTSGTNSVDGFTVNDFFLTHNNQFQGLWMGFLSAFGSLSRVLGPIFVSYIYTNFGTYPVMGFMVGSLVIALILTLTTYKRLVPMNFGGQNTQQTNSAAAASADARQPRLPEQPLERYRRLNSVTSSSM